MSSSLSSFSSFFSSIFSSAAAAAAPAAAEGAVAPPENTAPPAPPPTMTWMEHYQQQRIPSPPASRNLHTPPASPTMQMKTLNQNKGRESLLSKDEGDTWATAELGVTKEKEEDTTPEPAAVNAKLVSLRCNSQVLLALSSRLDWPPVCLAVHVPDVHFTTNVNTAIAKPSTPDDSNALSLL